MAYTEADVEQAKELVDSAVDKLPASIRPEVRERLWFLRDAALEGAKVPGLEAQAHEAKELEATLRATISDLSGEVFALQAQVAEMEKRADERREHLLDLEDAKRKAEAQVATLTAERDTLRAQVDALTAERDTLRAQVDALTAERDEARAEVERSKNATRNLEYGRQCLAKLDIEADSDGSPVARALWVLEECLSALSAPPAETTPATEDADDTIPSPSHSCVTGMCIARGCRYCAGR